MRCHFILLVFVDIVSKMMNWTGNLDEEDEYIDSFDDVYNTTMFNTTNVENTSLPSFTIIKILMGKFYMQGAPPPPQAKL